jgi:phosphatidylserine/phosphatidylglycerophosphate/cardiolipin synthase-like enzyme
MGVTRARSVGLWLAVAALTVATGCSDTGGPGPLDDEGTDSAEVAPPAVDMETSDATAWVPVEDGAAESALPSATTAAVLNDPTGSAAEKRAILQRISELAAAAPRGSTIRVAQYYVSDAQVPQALVAASKRGVNVRVLFSGRVRADNTAAYRALVAGLGSDTNAPSWVHACPDDRGCIGLRKLANVEAINHNKFFLFESPDKKEKVVLQTSSNLSDGRDATKGWNDAVLVAGNAALYDAYASYFDDLTKQVGANDYYPKRRPTSAPGGVTAFFFPYRETEGKSAYADPSRDPVMTVLNEVVCTGSARATKIRVAMHIFSRVYLAEKLHDLDAAGCDVAVTVNFDPKNAMAGTSMSALLAKATGKGRGPLVRYFCRSDAVWTHSKYVAIEGTIGGAANRSLVLMGSHNWSTNSLRQSDEVMIRLEDAGVVHAYMLNADAQGASAPHKAANGARAGCS